MYLYWCVSAQWYGPYGLGASNSTFSAPALALVRVTPPTLQAVVQSGDAALQQYSERSDGSWSGPNAWSYTDQDYSTSATDSAVTLYQGPGNSLQAVSNSQTVAVGGSGTTFSSPSLATVGTTAYAAAEGTGHSLDFYADHGAWGGVVQVAAGGSAFSAPSVAVEAGGTVDLAVEPPAPCTSSGGSAPRGTVRCRSGEPGRPSQRFPRLPLVVEHVRARLSERRMVIALCALWTAAVAAMTAPAALAGVGSWLKLVVAGRGLDLHRLNLPLGSRLLFPYGPYGYLTVTTPFFFKQWLEAVTVGAATHVALVALVCLVLVRRRAGPAVWVAVTVTVLIGLPSFAAPDTEGQLVAILLAYLAVDVEHRGWSIATATLCGLILALLILMKATAVPLTAGVIVLVIAGLAFRRRAAAAAALLAAFLVGGAVLWFAADSVSATSRATSTPPSTSAPGTAAPCTSWV